MFGIFSGIRFLSRWVYRGIVLAILLVIILLVARNPFLQSVTEERIRTTAGLEARMRSMDVAMFDQRATLNGLKIYNTAEFGGGVMLELNELHFELDPSALRRGELRIRLLRVDISELNLVVNEQGITNFDAVRKHRESRSHRVNGPLGDLVDPSLEFAGIDMLNLSVGRFTKTDLRRSGPPETIKVNIRNAVYQRLRDREDLLRQLTPDIVRDAAGFLSNAWFGSSTGR